ncbi:MAG: ester cyclase [Bacteroidetes bacterium]|nr:ester cyclase [Bacteroidota bacterium]
MEQQRENKEFVIRYLNALSGKTKTRELMEQYMTDEELLGHIAFFDTAFPKYEMFADEITAEGNRVVVRARMKGCHEGEFNGIMPTYKNVEFPFVVSYDIENGMIVHHWLIADSMALMEQLGVLKMA